MKREQLPDGEIAVLGLAKSGMAVSRLLLADGRRVYASDSVDSPATTTAAKTLNDLGADAVVGAHDLSRISRASLVDTPVSGIAVSGSTSSGRRIQRIMFSGVFSRRPAR